MADYHIYIHGTGGSGNGGGIQQKFTPTSSRSNDSFSVSNKFKSSLGVAKSSYNYATGSSGVGSAALGAVAKAVPWVAIAVAVAKTADKIISTGLNHVESYQGNYKYSVDYEHLKANLSWALNPVGNAFKMLKFNLQNEKQNIFIEEQRQLVGNSTLKNITLGV